MNMNKIVQQLQADEQLLQFCRHVFDRWSTMNNIPILYTVVHNACVQTQALYAFVEMHPLPKAPQNNVIKLFHELVDIDILKEHMDTISTYASGRFIFDLDMQ